MRDNNKTEKAGGSYHCCTLAAFLGRLVRCSRWALGGPSQKGSYETETLTFPRNPDKGAITSSPLLSFYQRVTAKPRHVDEHTTNGLLLRTILLQGTVH